ncbi:hypothetical protein ACE1ET_09650 [Saccharicrinis sp. FJH62]|uniref:hypothetical protein n=1 Tax=Saccharicrinis sp. FJH62 TaxID=3344657 RepID=UPI0035D4CA03
MLKNFLAFLVLFSTVFVAAGQTNMVLTNPETTRSENADSTKFIYASSTDGGVVHYYRDKRLDKIFDIQKNINKRKDGIPGFRVQLYRGNSQKLSKDKAFQIEAMVYQKFGADANVEVLFFTPYWRVQAGNFRTQSEAMKMEARYKKAFPDMADDISVVPAMIKFPELKRNTEQEYNEGQ